MLPGQELLDSGHIALAAVTAMWMATGGALFLIWTRYKELQDKFMKMTEKQIDAFTSQRLVMEQVKNLMERLTYGQQNYPPVMPPQQPPMRRRAPSPQPQDSYYEEPTEEPTEPRQRRRPRPRREPQIEPEPEYDPYGPDPYDQKRDR